MAFAIVISWIAAAAVVIGIAWAASVSSPNPPTRGLADSMPYALAWSGASVTMLAASLGSLFAGPRRRLVLLGLAVILAMALLAYALAGDALIE
jgi:ascorbate-specific PTS system EIIC-type component UlaA